MCNFLKLAWWTSTSRDTAVAISREKLQRADPALQVSSNAALQKSYGDFIKLFWVSVPSIEMASRELGSRIIYTIFHYEFYLS